MKSTKAGLSVGGALLVIALVIAQQTLGIDLLGEPDSPVARTPLPEPYVVATQRAPSVGGEEDIRRLIDGGISGEMVTLEAEVVRVLPDDNEGSRHQRLLLALESGGTVLVSHNIDLADRVPVSEGDSIRVRGQYEWNEKGGVIHWTHHDPQEWREGGWIEHDGERYE